MGDFEADTRVEPLGDGRYRAELSRDWEIWGPNGGYLASVALRACGQAAAIPRPASFGCHFLRVGAFDEVIVRVDPLQQGRRSESFAFRVEQGDKTLAAGMLRTAAEGPALEHDVTQAPKLPAPAALRTVEELLPDYTAHFPFWDNFDRKPPDQDRVGAPRRQRPPTALEWLRFRPRSTFGDDPFLDAARAVVLIDTFTWPSAAGPHPETEFTAPNIDLQVWFHRSRPADEWLLIDAESAVAEAGLMATHACVWGGEGELLASGGAQLLCVPPRPAPPAGAS